MQQEPKEEFYEHIHYSRMLKLKPDDFYLHSPVQIPYMKWFFEFRLQVLHMFGMTANYFGLRHQLGPKAQWFSDWVFLNHYQNDYQDYSRWKPSLTDRFRYYWLWYQGYNKEAKSYFEFDAKNDSDQLGIKERRFLKEYQMSRYWMYFDTANDDVLAYYRLGLDADEQLKDEDQPLFPNIVYSYPTDPRLAYSINGGMFFEHIPKYTTKVMRWLIKWRVQRKWQNGELVTYADIRKLFNPDTRKIHDLEFLLFCLETYDGRPEDDEVMAKLYEKLQPLYVAELTRLAQAIQIPELAKSHLSKHSRKINPLYVAYKQRWLNKNPVDFRPVFKGVTKGEYQKIVNKQYKHFEKVKRPKSKKVSNQKNFKKFDDLIKKMLNNNTKS